MPELVNSTVAATIDQTREHAMHFVRSETRRWQRFASSRADAVRAGALDALRLDRLEQRVLTRVDGTLRALSARVRARLAQLGGKRAKKPAPRAKPARGRGARPLPPLAA